VSATVRSGHAKSFDGRDWTDPAVIEEHAEKIFNDPNTDGWAIRQVFNEFQVMDGFAEIRILAAGLKACRRINDYALAVRFLESLARKTGGYNTELWAYIKKELQPTLSQLGILTPEEMGYDKPELALEDVYDM
jgi:cytochrome c oxidase subunit 5a